MTGGKFVFGKSAFEQWKIFHQRVLTSSSFLAVAVMLILTAILK